MSVSVRTFPRLAKKRYSSVRPEIQSGDLLLCSGTALMSKMIQRATNSVWSHVAFVLRVDQIGRVMVLESVESVGVRTVPLSRYVRNYAGDGKGYPGGLLLARHSKFQERADIGKLARFAVDHLSYPYDKGEIVRIAARIAQSWFGFTKRDVKRDQEYICSEYVWECYNSISIEVKYNPKGFIAPADFARVREINAVAAIKVE